MSSNSQPATRKDDPIEDIRKDDSIDPIEEIPFCIDLDDSQMLGNPVKKKKIRAYHRIHAHRNPLSDSPNLNYPISPKLMDWKSLYPLVWSEYEKIADDKILPPQVEMADIGCGYGGLTVALSRLFPNRLTIGMELRTKVVQYVNNRLEQLQKYIYNPLDIDQLIGHPHPICPIPEPILSPPAHSSSSKYFQPTNLPLYHNIAVIETNAMKFLPNYFKKGQLDKIFFLFPDPHFKKFKHRIRIINATLLAEYAYILRLGGRAYVATDVEELSEWMKGHFKEHVLFKSLDQSILEIDPVMPLILNSTEEARKVKKNNGMIYHHVFERIEDKSRCT